MYKDLNEKPSNRTHGWVERVVITHKSLLIFGRSFKLLLLRYTAENLQATQI